MMTIKLTEPRHHIETELLNPVLFLIIVPAKIPGVIVGQEVKE